MADEIGRIVQALGSIPVVLGTLLITFLILRSPAGLLIVKRVFNGHGKNGAPRDGWEPVVQAGDASVDFWKRTHRDIVDAALMVHEKDEMTRYEDLGRRYGDLRDALKDLAQSQREASKENRDGFQRVVDAITARRI